MSGAAGISAAKNRRSRQAPNQPPNINCSNVNGSCPTPNNRGQVSQNGNKSLSTMPDDSLLDKNYPTNFRTNATRTNIKNS